MATQLQPIRQEDLQPLYKAAAEDNHVVVAPTHVVSRDGEIIGYYSINAIPHVEWWLHTEKVKALTSIRLLNQVSTAMSKCGFPWIQTVIPDTSPFLPVAERIGYYPIGHGVLHFKQTGG